MEKKIKNERVQEYNDAGFYIIKPTSYDSPVPLFCPVCERQMKNSEDVRYYREYECCTRCGIEYAEGNKEKWNNGWRPELSRKEN